MLRKNANNRAIQTHVLVVKIRRDLFDGISQGQELGLSREALCTDHPRQVIQGGITDLAADDFAIVQHRELERQPVLIVADNFTARERHRQSRWALSGFER